MAIYTIGFTKKSAEQFFETLKTNPVQYLLDVRLHNKSQLAGFSKREDLRYFLWQIAKIEYEEVPMLAPEEESLSEYRRTGDWASFEQRYLDLIRYRQVERFIDRTILEAGAVLLCSEAEPNHCHRRLAAEYLTRVLLPDAHITHL